MRFALALTLCVKSEGRRLVRNAPCRPVHNSSALELRAGTNNPKGFVLATLDDRNATQCDDLTS